MEDVIMYFLGDLDNASLSKWRYVSHLIFLKHRHCVESLDLLIYDIYESLNA